MFKINTSAFRATSTATWQALRWGHCIFRHHPSCTAVDGLEVWPATQRTSMNQESKVSAPWTAQPPLNVHCRINLQISETPHVIQKICPLCLRCLYDLHFWSCLFRCTTKTWPGYMSWTCRELGGFSSCASQQKRYIVQLQQLSKCEKS